jgi:hypothetical protein
LHGYSVDQRPVSRAQIANLPSSIFVKNLGMTAAGTIIGNDDCVLGGSTYDQRLSRNQSENVRPTTAIAQD